MVSQYLPIHFVALHPIIKEILSKKKKKNLHPFFPVERTQGNFYGSGSGATGAKTNISPRLSSGDIIKRDICITGWEKKGKVYANFGHF